MQLDPVENNFRADKPWRTLLNLYRPERRWVFAAMISYLFKASPLWILPVIAANLTDIIAHRSAGGLRSLWINVAVGTVAIVQNIPSAMLYVDFLSRSVRTWKSTLVSLITGFHRPTSGRIFLDGVDMNEIDLRTFRRHLAIVSQQTILFNGTLRENIVYGTKAVSEEELQSANADANAANFIKELPRGIETEIGAGGVQLSGGQRQRIAIARAFLRNPRVLILDEATSALDAGSETVVQQALERLMIGRTTFIITHRKNILQRVDKIILLEKRLIAN